MVTIERKEWTGEAWFVFATVVTGDDSRSASHILTLPETASDADISAALLALYGG